MFKINSMTARTVQILLTHRLFIVIVYRYIDPAEDSFLNNDDTFQKIKKLLNPITSDLNSEEDKQLILKMIANCYHKYHNSIRAKSESDIELLLSTIMSLLIEQSKEIEKLGNIKNQ